MTIIAWRDGVIAADTGHWQGPIDVGPVQKLKRLADGTIYGCAGDCSDIREFEEWADMGFPTVEKPPKFEDFAAVLMKPDGTVWQTDGLRPPYAMPGEFGAVGIAERFALGCLAMGASPEQAVAKAIQYCAYCSGEVVVVSLDDDGVAEPDEPAVSVVDGRDWLRKRGLA
jgi:ATP-dependent HslUV protease subunit HslV